MSDSPAHAKQLFGNTAVLTLLQAASGVLVIALTPLMLAELGLVAYGFWALLNRVLRYALLTDFGLYPSIVRHIALVAHDGDRKAIRSMATIGLVYYCTIASAIMAAIVTLGPWLLSGVKLPLALHDRAPLLLTLFAGSWLLGLALWLPLTGVLNGTGMLRACAFCNAAGSIVFALVAAVLLIYKMGLDALIVASYIQTMVITVSGTLVICRRYGFIYMNPFAIPWSTYVKILKFGGWVQVKTMSIIVVDDAPSLLLGYFVDVVSVGLYDIGTKIARLVRLFAGNFNTAFLPSISALHAKGDELLTKRLIAKADRVVGILSLAAAGFVAATTPLILHIWLGAYVPSERIIAGIVAVVASVYFVENITTVGVTGALAIGKPWIGTWSGLAYALSTLAISLSLTPRLGVPGVLAGGAAGAVIAALVFFSIAAKEHIGSFAQLAGPWILPTAASVAVAAIVTDLVVGTFARELGRLTAIPALIACGLLYASLLLAMFRITRVAGEGDLVTIRTLLPMRRFFARS